MPKVSSACTFAFSLDTLGAVMKFIGAWLGKKATPDLQPRGLLGVRFADGEDTARVSGVLPGSSADLAGIHPDDVVLRIGDAEVDSIAQARRAISGHAPGDSLAIRVRREGKPVDLVVKLAEGL